MVHLLSLAFGNPHHHEDQHTTHNALSAGRSRTSSSFWRSLIMGLALSIAVGSAKAQVVYLDNTHTGCDYKVKVYYATGNCDTNHNFWICSGTQSFVVLTVGAGASVTCSLPPHTGACAYDIFKWDGSFLTSCNTSSWPYYCNQYAYTDCEPEHRYIDMNSACDSGGNTGTVKFY